MSKQKYTVLDGHINHDGKEYAPGEEIELTKEEAGRLSVESVDVSKKKAEVAALQSGETPAKKTKASE